MLPYLKNKMEGSVSMPPPVEKRAPDEEPEYDSLESAAQDLLDAVSASDVKGVCSALRAAFDLLESSPHIESSEEA